MTAPVLRPYQRDALDAVEKSFADGLRRVATVASTGAGKTVIFAELIRRHLEADPSRKVLVLAHRTELLAQAAAKIRSANPELRVGTVQGAKNQITADVLVASVQTLYNAKRRARLPELGLIIVDEAHRSMSTGYMNVLTGLGTLEPDGPLVAGYTATFTREDAARLTDYWQAVPYSIDIMDLIEPGHLVAPRFRRVLVEGLDLASVKTSKFDGGKDLASGDLAAAMERAGAPGVVAAAYRAHAADRQGIVFTPTVDSAEHVAEALRGEGITSAALSGATPTGERKRILADYQSGVLQTVVNCAILGEGFDAPETSCVLIARPTCSKILFRQQVGRALRPFPGKTDALILDMVGSTGRNDLKTLNDIADAPVHVAEDESLAEAAKRAVAERAEVEGDAMVSGSLLAVDYDPWDAERRSKLTKSERVAEGIDPAPEPEEEDPEPPEPRQRYQHIPQRSGWFLQSLAGTWFMPLRTESGQRGVIALSGTTVGLAMNGLAPRVAKRCATAEAAVQTAMDLTMILLDGAVSRSSVDPDARWRRKLTSPAQESFVRRLGAESVPRYSGQAGDLISLATQGREADKLAQWLYNQTAT